VKDIALSSSYPLVVPVPLLSRSDNKFVLTIFLRSSLPVVFSVHDCVAFTQQQQQIVPRPPSLVNKKKTTWHRFRFALEFSNAVLSCLTRLLMFSRLI